MPTRYLNTKKKINIGKINFQLIRRFYLEYICPYNYKFELDSGEVINLKFEENQLPHLLGLHKLRMNTGKKAIEMMNDMEQGKFVMEEIKKNDNKNLTLIRDRLCFFPSVETIINYPEVVIDFNPLLCIPTRLKCDFLLKTEEIKVTVYLGIRQSQEKKYLNVYL